MSAEDIAARVDARKQAEVVCSLMVEVAEEFDGDCLDSFWEVIRAVVPVDPAAVPKVEVKPKPFSPAEQRRFGSTPIPDGDYKGVPVNQVSGDVLLMYCTTDSFSESVKRYLAGFGNRRQRL